MTVTLTADAVGKKAGDTYTGPDEAFLLANGEASQAGYTGPGVSNTGPMAETPANDLTLAENREAPQWPNHKAAFDGFANDATNLVKNTFPAAEDVDLGGVDNDAPIVNSITPDSGPAGTVVHINGDNLEGVSAVGFGGTAGTALDVADNQNLEVTTGAHAAGVVDVVLTDASGNKTVVGGFTYTA